MCDRRRCAARDAGTAPTFSTEARLEGRTVLVTGANTGLGRQTALDCARRGARVLLACRDMTKCEEVRRTRAGAGSWSADGAKWLQKCAKTRGRHCICS